MTPERWRQVRMLFDEAAERAADERSLFLREACAGDADLEQEVGSLLASSGDAGVFLEEPAVERILRETPYLPAPMPQRIGPYEIVRELAQGGMGVVYLAERSDPVFRQTVALKLVRTGMDTDIVLRRFHGERQILAALDHPNIGRLLDGGSTRDGQPYFVMEYIPGRHLLDDCDARKLTTRQRLVIFQQICSAVACAHRSLVVHRDIKPGNILVTPGCIPKLLDFGLARVLEPRSSERTADRTETALRFLTPGYASPEQVRGERITTASDIYSLGVVLYELLTGHRPYRVAGRRPDEIARAVCDEEPEKPSTVVGRTETLRRSDGEEVAVSPASVSETREGDIARLKRSLRGDIDNIVLMALKKEPDRRYASVEALAEDIRRHLEGKPVRAHKDTLAYRSGKFVARHKAAVALAALVAALVLGTGVVAVQQARIARSERAGAERQFNDMRKLANTFLFEFHDAIRELPGSTAARQLVVRRALEYLEKLSRMRSGDPKLRGELAEAYERVARVQGGVFESHLGDTEGARRSLENALAIRESLAESHPEDTADANALAETLLLLAQVQMGAGDSSAAAASAKRAVDLLTALSGKEPADRGLPGRLARARRYLGGALARSDPEKALVELGAAVRAFEALAEGEPSNTGSLRELAIAHQMIIYALSGSPKRDAAFASYNRAVALQEGLIRKEPGNFRLRRELSYTQLSMGSFLEWSGDMPGALECYGKTVPIFEELVGADPRNAEARLSLAEAYNSYGYALARTGGTAQALENLKKSLRLFESLAATDPASIRPRIGLARLYESFATVAGAIAAKAEPGERARRLREARGWYAKSRSTYLSLGPTARLDRRVAEELDAVAGKLEAADRALAPEAARAARSD
jgi:eukaryotic-like serine/threonine-protein kinase